MDWISPGGRRYRAPYGANEIDYLDYLRALLHMVIPLHFDSTFLAFSIYVFSVSDLIVTPS